LVSPFAPAVISLDLSLMRMTQQVLTQQVLAIVIAVGCSNCCMNVLARKDIGGQRGISNRRLFIEFDQNDRAVYPVIENIIIPEPAYPREISFIDVREHFLLFDACM
jgi:hypothetical protein